MGSVLLVSKHGDGIPIANRLANEGHVVRVWLQEAEARQSLTGYKNPTKIKDINSLESFDLILFDMVGLGGIADKLKKKALNVIGGGSLCDKMELDRAYGEKICKGLTSLQIPLSEKILTSDELVKYLKRQPKAQVVKPLNNLPPQFSLISSRPGNEELISMVSALGNKVLPCLVQEKVTGIEISTEGWFNGEEFDYFNHTIEYKRFMEGDLGPNTGCMGNIVWACEADKLIESSLLPLRELLAKAGYVGPIDVNCIVTEKKAYFLEYTTRFGYDAIQAWTELIRGSLFDFLWRLFMKDRPLRIRDDYAIGIRLSMPPYPQVTEDTKLLKGVKVLDISDGARRHLHLSDVRKDESGREVLAGVDGVVGCATARGSTISEVRRRAYRTIAECSANPDMQYRRDIGAGVEEKIDRLKTWGWLDA